MLGSMPKIVGSRSTLVSVVPSRTAHDRVGLGFETVLDRTAQRKHVAHRFTSAFMGFFTEVRSTTTPPRGRDGTLDEYEVALDVNADDLEVVVVT